MSFDSAVDAEQTHSGKSALSDTECEGEDNSAGKSNQSLEIESLSIIASNSSKNHLTQGDAYIGVVDRLSNQGNAIIEAQDGIINLGPADPEVVGSFVKFRYESMHESTILSEDYQPVIKGDVPMEELDVGEVYLGIIDRISSSGNGIVELRTGELNLGSVPGSLVDQRVVFEYRGGHDAEILIDDTVTGDDWPGITSGDRSLLDRLSETGEVSW